MAKWHFRLVLTILLLIILLNTLLAYLFFTKSGYRFAWMPLEKKSAYIQVIEASPMQKHIDENKIILYKRKNILQVFEDLFVKQQAYKNAFRLSKD